MTGQIRVATDTKAIIGESPVWSARRQRLLWIDIMGGLLHSYDPLSGRDTVTLVPTPAGLLAEDPQGEIILGLGCDLARLDADGRVTRFARAPQAEPAFRFNDGKFDKQGRLWTGLMDMEGKKGRGILFRFDPDGTWHVADTGFDLPNGLEWSKDGETLYFTDSHKGEIYAYDFDPATGEIGNRRLFFGMDPKDGKPDGLTLDRAGHLLSVLFDGSAIARIKPNGSLERLIPLPVPRPTSCAFAGDSGAMFITTARVGLTHDQLSCAPQSGGLFEIDYDIAAQRSRISV